MIATFILFGLILLLIFFGISELHQQSLDWYGENSMLKVSRTYRASFYSQSDLFYWLLIMMSFSLFLISFKIYNDLAAQIIVDLVAFALLGLSNFYFWIKYQYWQHNGNRSYTFDPIAKKITIEGKEIDEISFDDIKKFIICYPTNYKLVCGGYIKIVRNNKADIYLTPLLPCYDILEEFLKGVEKQNSHKRIFKLN